MNEDLFQLGIKALIVNSEGHILLLKVNKEMLKGFSGDPYWDIPGGRIHRGSTIEETLKREVKEETGITNITRTAPLAMVLSNIRIPRDGTDTGLILSVYTCRVEEPISVILSNEHTEFRWFESKEAGALLQIKYPKEFTEKISVLHISP
ncbi:MAG: hypothetical protein A2847_00120 [Candidatus Sungbacteria bacterium RIFCSPHIGHO2_01_FULL_50_25]|uniref:Nudix hydrolase domain-containing protein n=1 Tax=Candidatus Sungbacteria bacterium RIFCSPHIGHO2_01_FULL_50_25 TaxID=1802265 RepID=A0A1G2K9L5_9BACT|nr:MAG: hypothetical protein A2847_00120 [Candidatus Sungbacteria bacterium RIFCSPHIGHO2_01_FULL_50_25]